MNTTEGLNSCLMLAVNLYLPVDLGSIFDSEDVTELEIDSHVTILFAEDKVMDRKDLLGSVKMLLDKDQFQALTNSNKEYGIFDLCDLRLFENDEDVLVLALKDSVQKEYCTLLNKALSAKYGITSRFKTYTPHITLATLKQGTGRKYMNSEKLDFILSNGILSFEDLMYSYGETGKKDKKQYFLTNNFCIDRYFRLENIRKALKELEQ